MFNEILSEARQKDKYTTYMQNAKKGYKWTNLQNRNRLTDTENRFMITKGEKGGIN